MKKIIVIACVFILALGTFTACGSGNKDKEPADTKTQEEGTESKDPVDPKTELTAEEEDAEILEQYVAQSQSALDSMAESMKDLMEMKVYVEGSKLIYEYKYVSDVGNFEAVKAAMDAEIVNQEATMKSVVQALKSAGVGNPTVVFKYLNFDGAEIATYEFM